MVKNINREQTNRITELQSALNEIRHKAIEELSTKLNLTMNKIVEASDDPKKRWRRKFSQVLGMK